MNDIFGAFASELMGPIVAAIAGIMAGLVFALLGKLAQLVNVKLDTNLQAILHKALETGLLAAFRKGMTGGAAQNFAVKYALEKGAPETIKKIAKRSKLSPEGMAHALHEIAQAHSEDLRRLNPNVDAVVNPRAN